MEEDEFGDFGGFEAAEPVAPVEARPVAQGVEASPSPWAVFAGKYIHLRCLTCLYYPANQTTYESAYPDPI